VLQIDSNYTPKPVERKVLFGMTLEQKRNDGKIDENLFTSIVTKRQDVRLSLLYKNIILNIIIYKLHIYFDLDDRSS